MKLSDNFTLEEMTRSYTARRLSINNEPSCQEVRRLQALCRNILQPIRDAWGAPIIVGSGYRCIKLNRLVGGVRNSDHLYGCAADIHTVSDTITDNRKLYELIYSLYLKSRLLDLKQCINEYDYNWIHISWQDGRSEKRGQFISMP